VDHFDSAFPDGGGHAPAHAEVAAGLAALAADWPRVGVFYGAAQAQMRQTGIQRDPADEAALAPHVDDARRALGTDGFDDAVRDGEQRTREAAIEDVRAYLAGPD